MSTPVIVAIPQGDVPLMFWRAILTGFDTETTGVDANTVRIVTAAIVQANPDGTKTVTNYLLNPQCEIPEAATAVHGITTEYARENGTDYREGIIAIRDQLIAQAKLGCLVAFNAAYDFTVLYCECVRLGLDPFIPTNVLDPYVMDKFIDQYRSGGRKLVHMVKTYGIVMENAHEATADADAAISVARAILNKTPTTQTPTQIHNAQIQWRHTQQTHLQAHLRKNRNDPTIYCAPGWPIY
jgi:DNA polymerase III subunit epsilon